MEALECQLFIERKNQEIECLAVTPNGYFCAVAQREGNITIFDTITFHSWLKILSIEQRSLRSLFFLKKTNSNSGLKNAQFIDSNSSLQSENLSETDSDCTNTTACTSPIKSPIKKSYHSTLKNNTNIFELYKYRLIGLGLDGRIFEWDLSNGMVLKTAFSYGGAIFQGILSPSYENLALACADGSVKVFSLLNNELSFMYSLPKHSNRLLSITYLNDNTIFAGSSDGVILEYNLEKRICINKMSVCTGKKSSDKSTSKSVSIWCLICLESDKILFSGDSNGTVILWDLITYTAINTFKHHHGDVLTLSKLANINTKTPDNILVSTGLDGRVVTYIHTGNFNHSEQSGKWLPGSFCYPHSSSIGSVATVAMPHINGPLALSGTWDGKLMLWLSFEYNKKKCRSNFEFLSASPRLKYLTLPIGVLKNPQSIHIAESERLILHQGLSNLELWFISDPDINQGINSSSEKILINPFQITYNKLNDFCSHIIEGDKKISKLIPVQPIKLLDIKLSNKKNEIIGCSALSKDGNYIIGSFSESGIKAINIDFQSLNINNIQLESCNGIIATSMKFLTNNILIIGGYLDLDYKNNLKIKPKIYFIDIERDIVVSFLELKHFNNEEHSVIGKIVSLNISPDNQWLAVLTSFGNTFIIDLDSFKLEVDLTNLESEVLNPFSQNNYSTPIASISFNNRDSDIVSVMMSDGKYYFYSISLKKIIPKEYIRNHKNYSDNSSIVYRVPKKIYSPILHGPILNINWIIPYNHVSKGSECNIQDIIIISTIDYTSYFYLNNYEETSNNCQDNTSSSDFLNSIHMEKNLCGPVYKLPRFKKIDAFTCNYQFFPERSFEFSNYFNNVKFLFGSDLNKDFLRKDSYDDIFLNHKLIYGVFWTNSPKWFSLLKRGFFFEHKNVQESQLNGCLIILSCKSNNKNRSEYHSEITPNNRRKYGD
ncbi:WD40 repeat-containing protein [Cryptosporidium ubiquitum]|uniref:WD40 repeat-containing protein n=1 Tax=Cryptosporidium ubiquitum TaxID=857276 RepID=A0A1J4MLJ3_9CRYT|nr:WD40 repeat-containing protein [Cryptosporidium ubiquitum]OII73741.1 WD40 repeat-containing protein [Cryptosporidium ubiquitum]